MSSTISRAKLALVFWVAAFLSVVLPWLPFGELVIYPFALLATWAHELGHGLMALLVGGGIDSIVLYPDLGGYAKSARPDDGLARALVAAAGLLAPSLAGGVIVVLGSRAETATYVLDVLGVVLVVSALLWIRNVFGFVAILGLGAGAIALGHFVNQLVEIAVIQIVGVRLCLESLSDVDYMFTQYFIRDGVRQPSDTQAIAEQLFLPYWIWGALIAALSVGILVVSFRVAWNRSESSAAG